MIYTEFISKLSNRFVFIVISLIIIAIIIDTSIIKISGFTRDRPSPSVDIIIFTLMVLVYAVGQYLILGFVKRKINESITGEQRYLNVIHKVVSIVQYVLTAILVSIILQMIITSGYDIFLVKLVIWISYSISIVVLGLLARRFFSWFKSQRNYVVLAYALAISVISINAGFTLLYVDDVMYDTSTFIGPHIGGSVFSFSHPTSIFHSGYLVTSVLSFILMWIATALILYHYSKKLGRGKYWIVVSIPLVYFLFQFQPFFLSLFTLLLKSDTLFFSIILTLVFSVSKPVGGVLFGIAFWSVARSIRRSAVRDYMIISAFGFMLLFTSNQATVLITAPYPPFGLATVSFMVLASYLISIGVYSAAVSIAQDVKLRQSLRKSVEQQSNLLDNIGTSQMEQEVQKKVVKVMKELSYQTEEKTGIQKSLEEQDIKEYLNKVIAEVKEKREEQGNR
jgi:hypothetical protein